MNKKTLMIMIVLLCLITPAFAWYNSSYDTLRSVNNLTSSNMAVAVNGTSKFFGNTIWINPSQCGGTIQAYYNSSNTSEYLIVCNDSTLMNFDTEGSGVDNSPTSVYSNNSRAIYHFGESGVIDSKGVYNGSVTGATWQSGEEYGGNYWTDGINDYLSLTTLGDFGSGMLDSGYIFFLKSNQVGIGNFFGGDLVDGSNTALQFWLNHGFDESVDGMVGVYPRDEDNHYARWKTGDIDINDFNWKMIAVNFNLDSPPLNVTVAVNGVNQGLNFVTVPGYDDPDNFANYQYEPVLGARTRQAGAKDSYANVTFDEVRLYDNHLTSFEIGELYNNSDNLNLLLGSEQVFESNSINILNSNVSNGTGFKSLFDEGENIWTYINWTDDSDNSPLTNSTGGCNLSIYNASLEYEFTDENFTLCGSGCDYSQYLEELSALETTNSVSDFVHFLGCHEQLDDGDVILNISCVSGSYQEIIPSGSLSDCDDGVSFVMSNKTAVCKDDALVNVSLTYSGINNRRKRIENLEIDRLISLEVDVMVYNSSFEMWISPHGHEFYENGNVSMFVNCTHDTNSLFNNDSSQQITIVNIFPVVSIDQVGINGSVFDVISGMNLTNISSQLWHWFISVVDNDIDSVNYTFYNNSGGVVQSNQYSTPVVENISSDLFVGFLNPYNFTVWANDSFGNVTEDVVLFNVVQVQYNNSPSCVVGESYVYDNASLLNIVFNCTDDENLSLLTILCDDGVNNFSLDLANVSVYEFDQNFSGLLNGEKCNWSVTDQLGLSDEGYFYVVKSNFISIGSCPTTTPNVLILLMILVSASFLLVVSLKFKVPFFGILSAIMYMYVSWFIAGCSAGVGLIFAGLSAFCLIFFAVQGFK